MYFGDWLITTQQDILVIGGLGRLLSFWDDATWRASCQIHTTNWSHNYNHRICLFVEKKCFSMFASLGSKICVINLRRFENLRSDVSICTMNPLEVFSLSISVFRSISFAQASWKYSARQHGDFGSNGSGAQVASTIAKHCFSGVHHI